MSWSTDFKPVTGAHSAADLAPVFRRLPIVCVQAAVVWMYLQGDDHYRFAWVLAVSLIVSWLIAGWDGVTRVRGRRRWKPGASGVVLLDVGPNRRGVRTELCRSLGIDADRAGRALRQPGTLIARDVDSVQAHVLAARLIQVGADARVVQRWGCA